jgi:diphthamide biosynthesis protein 3
MSLYLDSSRQNGNEAGETLALLAPDIEAFYSSIPAVINPFSEILSSSLASLRTIANVGTKTTPVLSSEPSRLRHRTRQSASNAATPLSPQLSARVRSLRETQLVELPASRRQMTLTAAEVLATRAQVLEQTVVLLERAKHGALARATKAKAEHLATVAQGMEGKLK